MGIVVKSVAPLLAVGALLAGCATAPPKSDHAAYQAYEQQNDPLKPFNKVSYHFDNKLDTYVLKPIALGYIDVTTPGIRAHVADFMSNTDAPAQLLEFMAAGKPRDAGTTLVRFLVNSTVGIGGLFDPAGALGYHRVYTDLGLTLAGYGVPEGPYLYLPFAGPSDLRDATGIPASIVLTPTFPAPPSNGLTIFNYGSDALSVVNTRAQLHGTISNIRKTSLDPYATFRSLYRQHRAALLKDINKRDVATPPAWYSAAQRKAMRHEEYDASN
ncbi:MAG: VacJ family lipoprotein [Acidiphilium sp.]|jgi:phospholipid-binding lipoprotein MlaA|nr:VacJ family lipoprotein [Acidiphilium sp.]